MTPAERRRYGRIGGLRAAARNDTRQLTSKARATFLASFASAVDPEGVLDDAERVRRATAMKRAHMLSLAEKSAQARAARKSRNAATAGDAIPTVTKAAKSSDERSATRPAA